MKRLIIMIAVLWMACMTGCSGPPGQGENGAAAAEEARTAEEAREAEEIQMAEGKEEDLNWEDNVIPVMRLEIDPGEFARVNESPDHSCRASGASLSVLTEDVSQCLTGLELDYIRGRGHGTWSAYKKAYRFKLEEGADLLGMGKNKHWVLLANRYDSTLLRNRAAAYRQIRVGAEPSFSDCDLLYSSDREEVASVDYFGVVHALAHGKARITVTCGDGPDLSLAVDVLVR